MEKLICTMFLLMVLSGCDSFHGLSRGSNPFRSPTNSECVLKVTESIKGISQVHYSIEEGGRPITLHGIEKPDIVHRFTYTYNGLDNNFYFTENYDREIAYFHVYGGIHWVPPQKDIDTIYPFFIELETKLKERCNFQNMKVYQHCSDVACPNV